MRTALAQGSVTTAVTAITGMPASAASFSPSASVASTVDGSVSLPRLELLMIPQKRIPEASSVSRSSRSASSAHSVAGR